MVPDSRIGPAPLAAEAGLAPLWREVKATFMLAWPLVLANLAQVAIQTINVIFLGWLGPQQLAGGSLAHHFFFPFFLFGVGIVMATAPMMAQELGAGETRGIRRTFRQGLWVSAVLALPAGLMLWNGRVFLDLLGQDPATTAIAEQYLRAVLWCLAPAYGIFAMRSLFSAGNWTRPILVVTLLGVAIHGTLAYGLIFGRLGLPMMGVAGAGTAATIAQSVGFAVLLAIALRARRFQLYDLLTNFWRPDWPRFGEIWRVGLPIGLGLVATSAFFSSAAFMMGHLGTTALAAHAIALQCVGIAFMFPLGLSQAAMVRVGFHAGARDGAAVGRAGWAAGLLALAGVLGTSSVLVVFGWELVDLFLDLDLPQSLAVAEVSVRLLLIAAFFGLADAGQVVFGGNLRGLKDTKMPMWLAVFGYWGIGLPACWFFAFELGLGPTGIWYGMTVGLYLVAALVIWRFHRRGRFWQPFAGEGTGPR